MRPLFAVAASGVLAFSLSGCAQSAPETTSSLSMPDLPEPSPSRAPSQESNNSAATAPAMEDCLMVAAGVSSMLLAPLSFGGDEDPDTMARLEDQLHHLHGKVPDELGSHFLRAADAAEGGPPGSGRFDEPAFREALEPVQEWLEDHCGDPAR